MATPKKKVFKNQLKFKDEKTLKPAKLQNGSTLYHQVSMTSQTSSQDQAPLMASFTVGNDKHNVAQIYANKVVLHSSFLGPEQTAQLKALFPECYDEANGTFSLPIAPPDQQHIDVYTKDTTSKESARNGGVFEMIVTNSQGVQYTCILDPLGVQVKTTNNNGEETVVSKRASIEDVTQEDIVNPEFTPALLLAMLDKNNPLVKTPKDVRSLSPQMIDLFYRHLIELGIKPDDKGAYTLNKQLVEQLKEKFPNIVPDTFDPKFEFIAVPAGNNKDGEQVYLYLTKNPETKSMTVIGGDSFNAFQSFNFVTKGDKTYIALIKSTGTTGRESQKIHYLDIPLVNGKLDANFIASITGFMPKGRENPHHGDGDIEPRQTTTGEILTQPAASGVAIESLSLDVQGTPITTHIGERGPINPPPPPPPPKPPKPHKPQDSTRKNPYQKPPLKAVKKKPFKIDENIALYGGCTAGLFLMAIAAFIFPPLMALGAVVFGSSMALAINAKRINDNAIKNAGTSYINGLAKAENEAESVAEKFWEQETELGNTRDAIDRFLAVALGEDVFKNGENLQLDPSIAFFSRFMEGKGGMWSQNEYKTFWGPQNLQSREVFLEDLQNLYALPSTNEKEIQAKQEAQEAFLRKYGIIKDGATPEQIENALGTLNKGLEGADGSSVTASQLAETAMSTLKKFNQLENRRNELHNEVGDIIEDCNGLTLTRIISQKGVDLDLFVDEHRTDLARRFMYRTDIPAIQIQSFLEKLTPEQINSIKKSMHFVDIALTHAEDIANKQKIYDEDFPPALEIVATMQKISEDKSFNKNDLKSVKEIQNAASTLLWATKAEDIKRKAFAFRDIDATLPKDAQVASYKNLLNIENSLLSNPEILSVLSDEVISNGNLSSLLTMTNDGTIGNDSLLPLFAHLMDSPKLGKEVKSDLQKLVLTDTYKGLPRIIDAKENLKTRLTLTQAKKLYDENFGDSAYDFKDEELQAKFEELSKTYPYLANYRGNSTELSDTVVKFMLRKESEIDKLKGHEKKTAKENLDSLIKSLASGDYADKLISDIEKDVFDNGITKSPQKLAGMPTRAESRADVLSFNNLLEKYGITKHEAVREIIEKASTLGHGGKPNEGDLLRALYAYGQKNVKLTDRSQPRKNKTLNLEDVFEKVLGKGVLIGPQLDNPETLKRVTSEIEGLRATCFDQSKRDLTYYGQIAGRRQVEKVFNNKLGNVSESVKEGSYKPTRAEKGLTKATGKYAEFVQGAGKVVKGLGEIQKGVKGGSVSKKSMKEYIKGLKDSIEKSFGTRAMKNLFDGEHGKDALSWEKLASGNITEREFKVLQERIQKLIKEKEKKLKEKIKKKKEKALKNKSKRKKKAKTKQQIADNQEKFEQASQAVLPSESAHQSSTTTESSAPTQSQESGQTAPTSSSAESGQ